jgi:hypothetical protein
MDVSDLDLAGDLLLILGKSRLEKERVTLPAPTKAALEAWLQARRRPRVLIAVKDAVTVEAVGEFELKGIRRPVAGHNVPGS